MGETRQEGYTRGPVLVVVIKLTPSPKSPSFEPRCVVFACKCSMYNARGVAYICVLLDLLSRTYNSYIHSHSAGVRRAAQRSRQASTTANRKARDRDICFALAGMLQIRVMARWRGPVCRVRSCRKDLESPCFFECDLREDI